MKAARISWNALTISLAYAAISIVWITFSDRVLAGLDLSPEALTLAQSLKGALFVFASALLLFVLIRANNRQLRRAEQQLRDSETRFRDWAQLASDWFWETDAQHQITFLSRSKEGGVEDELSPALREAIVAAVQTPVDGTVEERRPFRDQRQGLAISDGNCYWISLSGKPRFDGEDRFLGYRGTVADVTSRTRAQQALRRSQKMEAVGQLTGGLAHDFNNLLGVMVLYLDSLRLRLAGDEESLRAIDVVLQAARRGAQMTQRLLDFSRPEPRRTELTNVNDVVAGMKELVDISLPSSVDYRFEASEELWLAEIDPGELQDVVLNLVINARDAMPDGGQLVIETENRTLGREFAQRNPNITPGDYVVLTVSDTGAGIAPELIERIFDPFFTTKEEDRGTGLGLSMAYAFVQRSKGDIKVYSQEGYGTTFRLFLPRASEGEGRSRAIPALEALPGGEETILVVDDEAVMRDAPVSILGALGYRVLLADHAEQALEILAEEMVDLLFTDIVMPGEMMGVGLARAAQARQPGVKVLLTSGLTLGQLQVAEADNPLVANLLTKPYDRRQLAYRVRHVLDADG
ncbi:MAG TPA: ATP-binding protein [Candidatus Sulfomarinibacteraceae bacterium]|nr:ATP-binding protein [Candidatus Sulfomarinibacteraceae bacterium]